MRERLSVLIAIVLLGSVLFRFIELPTHTFRFEPLGSPLEITLTGTWLLGALMVTLTCTGMNAMLLDHPRLQAEPSRPTYAHWILPGILAGLAPYFLATYATTWLLWLGGLALLGISLGLAVAAEYVTVAPDAPDYPRARLALNVLAYLLAFIIFAVLYHSRSRSLVTATVALLVAALVALDLLSVAEASQGRTLLYAGLVGVIIGESTWALNYWQVSGWTGGLFLLLVFYVVTGLAHQHLLERLSGRVLAEFAVVAILALVIILRFAP